MLIKFIVQELLTPQSTPMTTHLDKIGIIALKVYRVREHGIDVANNPSYEQESLREVTGLTEKSLKGIDLSHSTQYVSM